MSDLFDAYPYADRYPVLRGLPEQGRPREELVAEFAEMSQEEDRLWEGGQCSGTMYCGDHDHYAFLTEAFGRFAHMNALQRDMCPSATRFEGEIIAMALDLMHAEAVTDTIPAGMVTSGGTGSIIHAMLCYREAARARGVDHPVLIKPETAHPAFAKAAHLFGMDLRVVPVDPVTTLVDPGAVADAIDANTACIVGSAGNYPYGTIDPIADLGRRGPRSWGRPARRRVPGRLHPPVRRRTRVCRAALRFPSPGVTSISADTHKYGYGLKGTSTLLFRDKSLRNLGLLLRP
jgi:sphinganine-1-phosphate aldolase